MTFAKILTHTNPKLSPAGLILEFTGEPQRTAPVCKVFREYAEKQYERLCTAYADDPYLKAYLSEVPARVFREHVEQQYKVISAACGRDPDLKRYLELHIKPPSPELRLTNNERVAFLYSIVMGEARKDGMPLPESTLGLQPARLSEISKSRDIWIFFAEVARKLAAAQQFVGALQGNLVTKAQAITAWMDQHQHELGTVRSLNLREKKLAHLPRQIGYFQSLRHLDLDFNSLTTLPLELFNCTELSSLDLNNNFLTEIPREIGNLADLRHFIIGRNSLTEIPTEIGNCSELRELYLHNNRLTAIPPAIGRCTQLHKLELRNNFLTEIPAELGSCTQLVYFHLPNNRLREIPPEIGNCASLGVLTLHQNPLTSLPAELDRCAELRQLYLDPNHNLNLPPRIAEAELGPGQPVVVLVHQDNIDQYDHARVAVPRPLRMHELVYPLFQNMQLNAVLPLPLVAHEPTLWECICEIATLIIDWIAEKIGALVDAIAQPFRS